MQPESPIYVPVPIKPDHRFMHKVEREPKYTRLTILDNKTRQVYRLVVTNFATAETIRNTIKNFILTSIDTDDECEPKRCPDAPVKKRLCFRQQLIEGPTLSKVGDKKPQVCITICPSITDPFLAKLTTQCKMNLKNGNRCKCDTKSYGRCNYHLQLWKKAHPFQKHP